MLFRRILIAILLISITKVNAQSNLSKPIVLVIDAGHGGKDPGNLASSEDFEDEKHINLKIAKKTGNYIDSLLDNVTIIYTRTTDVYLSPEERAEIANNQKADYFMSIHCNHSTKSEIYGVEIHIHNDRCKESIKFANQIDADLTKRAKRHSRGIKNFDDRNNSNIMVVRDTEMPAVLIECGFMSNAEEEEYLNSDYGQTILASALYRSFRQFSGATVKPDCDILYKVQIKASVERIALDSREFRNVDSKIEEVSDKNATYKYKYYVGNFCSKEEANSLRKTLSKKGYKDAFVVKIEK